MLKYKGLQNIAEYTKLFSPGEYEKNDKIILKYFQQNLHNVSNVCNKYRKSKKTKLSYIFKKTLSRSVVYSKSGHEYKKIFKQEKSIEILKVVNVINNIGRHHRIYILVSREYNSRTQTKKNAKIRTYLFEEIYQNELISKKHKKSLNNFELC